MQIGAKLSKKHLGLMTQVFLVSIAYMLPENSSVTTSQSRLTSRKALAFRHNKASQKEARILRLQA